MMGRRELKILVVDDHPIVRGGLRAILETQPGWHVCAEAGNGEEAVRLTLEHAPHVV